MLSSESCCLRELSRATGANLPILASTNSAECPCSQPSWLHHQCCGPLQVYNRMPSASAVVMQTHVATASIASHMALAQRQLSAKGIGFFVNFLVGDGEHDRCPEPGEGHPALDLLRHDRQRQCQWSKLYSTNSTFAWNISAFAAATTTENLQRLVCWAWLLCERTPDSTATGVTQPLAPESGV